MGIRDDIKRVKLDVRESATKEVVALALGIHGELVDNPPTGTPVDTGWASANWWPSVAAPATANTGRADEGSTAGRESQRAAGVTQVLSYQLGQGSIYITNNVPYIDRLNNGWSQQSPAGFVDRAVQVAVTNFRARK
ncbi:MAG: neck protein [Siphoviridae sp. ctdc_1]|nr:MAG: neck protein [Siphoviridae sp. ctdc_1]